jgi:DNA-binding CsgD family transcriptional regulator
MTANSGLRGRGPGLTDRRAERGLLDQLVSAVRAGESRVLVVHGEPGVGKTALLEYLTRLAKGCRVVQAVGVQSEMELGFAGLHQLCAPMLDRLEALPVPQRDALRTAFGLSPGLAPERFLVGLAVLGLLSEVAGERPLVCLVDDQQWLDRASAQALGFAARRLAAEPVGLIFAARVPGEDLTGLPELVVEGLPEEHARALLNSTLAGSLDAQVRDQILAEARGNPLALLELPQGLTPAELAGGFGLPGPRTLSSRIEDSFRRQLDALPEQTRRLLHVAAADPSGDPLLVWRAAGRLGLPVQAAAPAVDARLVEFGVRVRFRHPLMRSAAYRSASPREKEQVHRALAEVTDPVTDPDRRAWHRARAAPDPDEDVATELERSAARAHARGGLAAAAAFLERAALLTPDLSRRAQRLLTASRAKCAAGALDAAGGLLSVAESGPLDEWQAAELDHQRGQIAFDQRRASDAARLLLSAARRLEPLDPALARETHLESLWAAVYAGDLDVAGGVRKAAEAARAAPPGPDLPRAVDALLDAFALQFTEGYTAAAPAMSRALELMLAMSDGSGEPDRWLWPPAAILAFELWDFESLYVLADRQVQAARETGALAHLQFALSYLALCHILRGELSSAARLVQEDRLIAEATRNPPLGYNAMMLAAWRGREQEASELIEATVQAATARGLGIMINLAACAGSALYNALGQYEAARDAAWRAFERDHVGFGSLAVPELAEAASRTGEVSLVRAALEWLAERARVMPTEWVLGMESRVRALLHHGDVAEGCYKESIERLGRTPVRAELARAHLLYGEWLRGERRRGEARERLRMAYDMLTRMGMEGFAERARRELLAAGETAGQRAVQPARTPPGHASEPLTVQEIEVARLARDGLSNPEIGARLFISTRTVQYHLGKVFTKLGISSRGQLHRVLSSDVTSVPPR